MAEFSYVLKKDYTNSFDSLKNISHDTENNIYMCQSDMRVVNFDHLTRELNPVKQPSSYDGLLINESLKKVYCIEFKNQITAQIDNQKLHKKVEDSSNTIQSVCKAHNVAFKEYKLILCIVYKSNPIKHKYHRFKENIIHFGLDIYRDQYFNEVITNDIEFFKKEFNATYKC